MNKNRRIIQIVSPASSVFAVYNEGKERYPKSKEDLLLFLCPVVALIEDGRTGEQEVIGLCVEDSGLEEPTEDNVLGYANSHDEAIAHFAPESKR